MYKKAVIFKLSFLMLLLASCGTQVKVEYDYWRFQDGDSSIRLSMETVNEKVNGYCYKYYRNGQLLSKAKYKDDKLVEIFCVYDSLGNPLPFGNVKNGTGYAISYSDEYGTIERSGNYVNGERHGWWKNYTFRGEFTDSFYCDMGDSEMGPYFRYVLY